MGILKRLTSIKKESSTDESAQMNKKTVHMHTQTYHDSGYNNSKQANGSSKIFRTCLEDIYGKFKDQCREDELEQKKLKAPYETERTKLQSVFNARETLKSIKEDEVKEIDASLEQINKDIAGAKSNPDKYGIDVKKKPKAQFFIGLILLIPITLYLVVFYISASYSAFFKNFEADEEVIAAIFDAKAFGKAVNDGWLEAIFVCTIPFAFMGLGYLIHMFQKEKKTGKYKIMALFLVTFIFDSILAYQIEKKIYEINKTLLSAEFSAQDAFSSVSFWGIIFAGFVVYIIWGLVFDLVMKEYENFDKIKVFIRKLKEDKINLKEKKVSALDGIKKLTTEVTEINSKISGLQAKIDGFIFPNRKYLRYHAEYVKGWYMAIAAEIALPKDQQERLIEACDEISKEHLEKHMITNENVEGVIYDRELNN